MRPKRSLIKLLLGAVIAGILIKYAAEVAGPGTDPVPLISAFLTDLVFHHAFNPINYQFFDVNTLLWFIILLLIALVPFMFSLFSGVWGFLTYLSGFLSGYFLNPEYWVVGVLCLATGVVTALYGEYIR